jgi:hypothetical protein
LPVTSWPTVEVSVLGRSYQRLSDKDLVIHRDGWTPGCRRLE